MRVCAYYSYRISNLGVYFRFLITHYIYNCKKKSILQHLIKRRNKMLVEAPAIDVHVLR
jgi:hypothetical protein